MTNLLYSIALILIFIWAISYISYHQSGLIHILLVVALIAVVFNLVQGTKKSK